MSYQLKQLRITAGQWLLPDEQTSAQNSRRAGTAGHTLGRLGGVSPPSGITGDFEPSIYVLPKQEHWGWCIESGVALGEIS